MESGCHPRAPLPSAILLGPWHCSRHRLTKGGTMSFVSLCKTIRFLFVFCAATAIASPAQTGCSVAAPCFTILASFNGADGSLPIFGPLVQGFDGNFYGTAGGGAHNDGVLFKITSGGTLTPPLHSFNGTDGAGLNAGLVLTANGNFYG